MQRWEYASVTRFWSLAVGPGSADTDEITVRVGEDDVEYPGDRPGGTLRILNELGADGWEVCGFDRLDRSMHYLLKRPLKD